MFTVPALLACWLLISSGGQSGDPARTAQLRRQFAQLMEQAPALADDVLRSRLEQILQVEDKFAPAHAALARIYLRSGTLQDRIQAIAHIERAIVLDPINAGYRVLEGEINLQRDHLGFRTRAARKSFEKAVQLDPRCGEAWFQLGCLSEATFLHYRHVQSRQAERRVNFEKFVRKDARDAIAAFEKAMRWMADPAPAYQRLALLYYELGDLQRMEQLLSDAIALQPGNSELRLFAGLVAYKEGKADEAARHFKTARELMTPQARAVFDSIEMVMRPEDAGRMRSLPADQRAGFVARYWIANDPLYLTDLNERQLEHYARVAYANLRFSVPRKGIAGYMTDPGKTLIRFGFPNSIIGSQAAITIDRHEGQEFYFQSETLYRQQEPASGGMSFKSGGEVWQYDSLEVPFEDRNMNGTLSFAWGGVEGGADGKEIFRRAIKKTPEIFKPSLPGALVPVRTASAIFRGEDGAPVWLLFGGLRRDAQSMPQRGAVRLRQGLFVFDAGEQRVIDEQRESPGHSRQFANGETLLCSQFETHPPAGRYRFSLEMIDETAGLVGVYRDSVVVPPLTADRLQMSDLLLAERVEPAGDSQLPFTFRNIRLLPSFSREFPVGEAAYVLFDIYQLSFREGMTSYRVSFTLEPIQGGRSGFTRALTRLFGGGADEQESVTTSYDFRGQSAVEFLQQKLQFQTQPGGAYRLRVGVRDLNAGSTAEKQIELHLVAQ